MLKPDWVSLQFFLSEQDLETSRAEASRELVAKLNKGVQVSVHTGDITEELLLGFQVPHPHPTLQVSPVPSSWPELSSGSGLGDHGVHPGGGANYLEAGGAVEGGHFMP